MFLSHIDVSLSLSPSFSLPLSLKSISIFFLRKSWENTKACVQCVPRPTPRRLRCETPGSDEANTEILLAQPRVGPGCGLCPQLHGRGFPH